jgi:hypothetical protein
LLPPFGRHRQTQNVNKNQKCLTLLILTPDRRTVKQLHFSRVILFLSLLRVKRVTANVVRFIEKYGERSQHIQFISQFISCFILFDYFRKTFSVFPLQKKEFSKKDFPLIPFSFRFRVIRVKEKRERSAGAGKTDKRGF